jgi:branched-chain amino acid transport system substrate-binding protein
VILGSSLGALCKVTIPLYATGPVDYCFSPVIAPPPNGNVFSASVSGTDLIRASIRYFRGRGWTKFATLNTTDASGQIADADIANALKLPENKDMQLVVAEHFNATDTGVSAQIAKIKAAAPQAIIVWAPGTPFGTALHGINDVGLDIPVMTTSANMIVNQMKSYAGFMPKDVYFQGVQYIAGIPPHVKDTKPLQVFTAAMKSAGIPQDFQSGIAWDPAMIVVDALRKLGPNASASDLHDYLEKLHDYTGIAGVYDFRDGNQRGLTVDDTLIMRWDPDKTDFVSVSKYGGLP